MAKANAPHSLADLIDNIGKITLAWNDLHLFVFSIFWRLNGNHALRSKAIFFAVRADRTQRDMTMALVQQEMTGVPLLQQAAIDALNEIGNLSGRRNAVIHAMWAFEADWDQGTATVFAPSSPKLARKRLGEELDKLYEDLVRLGARLASINKDVIKFCEIVDSFQKPPAERPPQPSYAGASPLGRNPPSTPQGE
jgi:hypothetical protein